MIKFLKILLIGLLFILAIVAGMGVYRWIQVKYPALTAPDVKYATILQKPRAIQSFSLTDMNGKPFTNENFKGKWSLIFFGFSHCPAVCPTALANINKVYKKLEEAHVKKMPEVVFISVDPERDTPAVLKKFLSHFNPHFMGVTGSEKQIAKLAKELGAVYMEVEAEPQENSTEEEYTIDHSAAVLVIDPEGNFHALFSSADEVEEMAADLKKILR